MAGFCWWKDADIEAGGVVVLEIFFDLGDKFGVVSALRIEPENSRSAARAGAADSEFHPIADRGILGLAGTPYVPSFNLMLEKDLSFRVGDAHRSGGGDFEGLVVRSVFLSGLGHEPYIRNGAHGFRIEGAIFAAEINDGLIDGGVATIGNDGERLLGLTLGVPHFSAFADHGRHRGVHDDIARDMEVGDAFVRVHHREWRACGEGGLEIRFNGHFFRVGKFLNFRHQIAKAVVEVDAEFGEHISVLLEEVTQIHFDGMAEENRVGYLHHGRLEVE